MQQTTAVASKASKATNGTTQPGKESPTKFTTVRPFKKSFKRDPEERKNKVLAWKVKTEILEQIKKQGIKEESAFFAYCTTDMAMDLLTWNDMGKNRYLDESRIEQNKNELKSGNFPVNGDTIRISKTFKLLDGQHRLWAIVESGVPLKILIVTGLDDKTMSFMDIGKNRSALDMVVINEYRTSPTALAYVIKNILYYKKTSRVGSSISSKDVPNFEVNNFLQKKKQINDLIMWLEWGKTANEIVPKWLSPAQWAFIYYLLWNLQFNEPESGQKRVYKFMEALVDGTDLSKGSPIKILRDNFMADFKEYTSRKKKNKVSNNKFTLKVKGVVDAWNKYFKYEKDVKELEINDDVPEIPKPISR